MIAVRSPEEIHRWHVAFHLKKHEWRGEPFIRGRFAHVSAFAWANAPRVWLLMDFSPRTGPHAVVWPFLADELELPAGLAQWIANAGILAADVRRNRDFTPKGGLWCVSQVKQLLGLRSWALSPEGLWRDMVRQGARVVWDPAASSHGQHESPGPAAGSDAGSANENGADPAGKSRPELA